MREKDRQFGSEIREPESATHGSRGLGLPPIGGYAGERGRLQWIREEKS